jgi:iron complex outermembrane receptor protein
MKQKLMPLALASILPLVSQCVLAAGPAIVMGEVRVNAQRDAGALRSNKVLTSVDVLGADKIEDKNVTNSWELVGQLPGVQLTETRMGAESGKASFRAFNGEGYINGIKVLIDGIPSNVNSGNQRFIDMIFPLEVDVIEVVRGTNDPRYGLHNIGGNLNIGTRQGGNYVDSRFTYGSFNTREVQAAYGREADGFAQNYFVARQLTDSYRQNGDSNKYSVGGKWFVTSKDKAVTAGLVLRTYEHTSGEPGFLTAAELAADRRQSPLKNANDKTDRDMHHASAHLDWQISPDAFLSNKLYYNEYKDDRRVTFTSNPEGNAPRQRRMWDEAQLGFMSNLTWRAGERVTVDGGVNTERQDNGYRRLRYNAAIPTDFTTPARVQNDDRYKFNNVGAYVQAVIKATDTLSVVPGYRVDRFTGNQPLPGGTSAGLQDYGWMKQPKFSMVYSPAADISVYGNWGRTFQILTGSGGPAYLVPGQAPFDASVNTGKEVGVKLKPTSRSDLRLAIWRQDATGEVANMPATGTTVGLGETRREGLDFQLSGKVTDKLELWMSHSLQKAEVISATGAGGVSLAGKEVFSTPRHISNVGADYKVSDAWRFGLQGRSQGDYYIDNPNEQGKFGGFVLFDASVHYKISARMSLDVQVKNIADRAYEYAWYDNFFWPASQAQPMYSSGNGRAAYISLNVKL